MSASTISIADMLEIQLRKWIGKRCVTNIKLGPTCAHPSMLAGEIVIAEIIDRNGQGLFFSRSGFTMPGHGFINYEDVAAAEWISSEPFGIRARRKHEDYDHIELLLRDGSSVILADIEQAVFPLLRFFKWMQERKRHVN